MWVIYVRWCYMIILFCLDECHDFLVLPIQLSQLSCMHFNKWWIQVLIKFLFCFVWFFHWTSFIFYDCTSTSLSTIWFCLLVMFMKFNTNARFKYFIVANCMKFKEFKNCFKCIKKRCLLLLRCLLEVLNCENIVQNIYMVVREL